MLVLLASLAFGGSRAFYPGIGPDRVEVAADGTVHGFARTGDLLVHADDPSVLAALPEVAAVHVLRGPVARLALKPGIDDIALAVALRDRPDVAWAHPDLHVRLRASSLPNDPYLPDQWHLQNTGQQGFTPGVDIGAAEAWDLTRGAGQLVAIFDTGIDIDHPDLRVIDGRDYVDDDDSSDPIDDPHGTACAGLAVGTGDNALGTAGVAYEATAYGIRIIGNSTLTDLYDGFAEAVDAGATVLSNSWGFLDDCNGVDDYGIIADAFAYAEEEGRGGLGSAVVFAAGNGNCDISGNNMLEHETVITVAAVNGFDVREPYSSFGPYVDIAAPSGGMHTTDIVGSLGYNGYPGDDDYTTWFNGTSASTPVVAGVVALMFAANERLTASDVRDALCDTAVRVDLDAGGYDALGWSPYYGCGRIDAGAAVRAVANAGPPDPPAGTPEAELRPDAAVLTWTDAEDPDGDPAIYTVRWWVGDGREREVETERPWLDLTGEVADGDVVSWVVLATDLWGPGAWSSEATARVVAPEEPPPPPPVEEPAGCATTPGFSPWGLVAALAGLSRRRVRGRR